MIDWTVPVLAWFAGASYGVEGESLFLGKIPDTVTPDTLVTLLVPTAGTTPEVYRNVDYPRLQVVVRGTVYVDVQARAFAIYNALRSIDVVIPHVILEAIQSPFSLGQDPKFQWHFSQNYQLTIGGS